MHDNSGEEHGRRPLPFAAGDKVRIVQGPDTGRKGQITAIYPTHARPYRVQLGDSWFVHFAEDRLAQVADEAIAMLTDRA